MIGKLAQVLQLLEYVLLFLGLGVALLVFFLLLVVVVRGLDKVVLQLLLYVAQFTFDILNNLGRQVVQHVFLETTQQERHDLLMQSFERQCGSFFFCGAGLA